jgi:hypothetical protein
MMIPEPGEFFCFLIFSTFRIIMTFFLFSASSVASVVYCFRAIMV